MSPYQDYKEYTSRFVSEFGFESAPSLAVIHRAISDPYERHAQSRTMETHDKGRGHERRYGMYMSENFRFRLNPLKDFVYCTQALQAEAMSYAYNCWRREFRGPGEENCSGVLVWQLNDIWPGTSWALVDVDLNRKPAFYITKRALHKVVVGMERIVTKEPPYITTGYRSEKAALDIWAVNGHLNELTATLKLSAFDIGTGKKVELPFEDMKVTLKPNQTTEIMSAVKIPKPDTTVIAAYLDDASTGERLVRWVSWPEPLKYLHFSKHLKITTRIEGKRVLLSANTPAKGVVLSVPMEEGPDAVFSDNYIDVVPEEEIEIAVEGLNRRNIQVRYLCDWEKEEGYQL
jgi:beta-mannosidase